METNSRRYTVYLAGKMGGRSAKEVRYERARAAEACAKHGIEFIDPAANEQLPWGDTIIDLEMDHATMKNFVAKDEHAISKCNALLVLTGDTPSDGTGWEMGYATFALGIPVFMVAPRRCSGSLMGFGNIKATSLHPTVEDAVEFIAENYGGK